MLPHSFTGAYTAFREKIGVVVGLAALLFLVPVYASGQTPSVQSLIEQGETAGAPSDLMRSVADRAKTAGLSRETTAELLQPAVSLAERNLPAAPLLNKTLEGFAKQVPPSRMTSVLQQIQTQTESAGALASRWLERASVQEFVDESAESATARDQFITNVTEAQQQDVPLKNVEQFLNTLPDAVERRPVSLSEVSLAVSVMPDLPGSSSGSSVTHQLLSTALDAGYDAESMRQLPAALDRARRQSQRPVDVIAREATQAIAQDTPAANVLRSLFQGNVPAGDAPPSEIGNGPPDTPPGQGKPPGRMGSPNDNPGNGPPGDPRGGGGGGR